MRIVTRGDMDGLSCAVIISLHEKVDGFLLIHPQDITDRRVEIRPTDILANVPYHPNCAMWFDHHMHTATYSELPEGFRGVFGEAPSTARLVYEFYGGAAKLPQLEELVRQTDRMDSADLTPGDVTDPRGYILLGFTIDSRTGLGAFEDYMMTLLDLLRRTVPVEEVLAHPAVSRRVQTMRDADREFRKALLDHSRVDGNVVLTDLRDLTRPPVGNRFLVYALFPDVNVSLRVHWGPERKFAVAVLGHSIFNRSCATDVGLMAARFGGGGHRGAASVPLPLGEAEGRIAEIVAELKRNG